MFIKSDIINSLKEKFGCPRTAEFHIPVGLEEYDRIKGSQKNNRQHDVTLYIEKDSKWVVIAKHFYPPGMYRAPSGGINPSEDFIEGAKREALEETGCDIELIKFLLLTNVIFYVKDDPDRKIEWHSYVFHAKYISGDFDFSDTKEIKEVKLADLSEFEIYKEIMLRQNIGGLNYRAGLHDKVKDLISS
jgi:8-oxo-dGTP pyrophosphatase MutT (NUDIX family)